MSRSRLRATAVFEWALIGLLTLLVTSPSGAQGTARYTVRGVTYDSLRARPLPGALVTIESLARVAISDSAGAFAFDSVPAGDYDLLLQHDYLDSLGLGEPRTRVTVPGEGRRVLIATPSFSTVWGRTCGTRAPHDSGFVHGVVRDARSGDALPGLVVEASWLDVGFDSRAGVSQQRLGGSVTSDGRGRYAICGVPNGVQLLMRARLGDARTDEVELFHVAPGLTRRDFLVAMAGDSALRGVAKGVVRGAGGGPVPNALVESAGARDARTDSTGAFTLTGIPLGTRSLTVRSIGAEPMRAIVDVAWRDTAAVEITLRNVPTLTQVEVVASAVLRRFLGDLERRRQIGIAKFIDSTRAARYGYIQSALTAASGARMSRNGTITFGPNDCSPGLWIDRRYVRAVDAQAEMRLFNPAHVGAIEIYERPERIPVEFMPPVPDATRCIVIIWTKAMFP